MTRRLSTTTLFPTSILLLLTCSAFSIGPPDTKLTKAQKRVDRTIAVNRSFFIPSSTPSLQAKPL